MALYLGKKKITPIKVVDLPDDLDKELTEQETLLTELEAQVDELSELDNSKINIEMYKYQDLTRTANNGGVIATDEEYNRAEEYLQNKYALIMGG